jgi:osmoprotectant transport system substrate-binding protein
MLARRTLALIAATGLMTLSAGCGSDDLSNNSSGGSSAGSGGGATVRISGQNFPEAQLVAAMYDAVLTDAGYNTSIKLVDTRDVYMQTFPKDIDVVPEYVGGIVDFLNTTQNGADAAPMTTPDAAESISKAQDLLKAQGITLLDPSPATDTNAFFVTKDYADSNGASTLSDLKGKTVTLAAAPDCETRTDCGKGLEDTYGINITKVLPLGYASAQTYKSVLDGESELGETSTTDGTLDSQGLVLLDDDQHVQPAQNLVPAVSSDFLAQHGDVKDVLDKLMAALDTTTLTELNGKIAVDREDPATVAHDWCVQQGLISG